MLLKTNAATNAVERESLHLRLRPHANGAVTIVRNARTLGIILLPTQLMVPKFVVYDNTAIVPPTERINYSHGLQKWPRVIHDVLRRFYTVDLAKLASPISVRHIDLADQDDECAIGIFLPCRTTKFCTA